MPLPALRPLEIFPIQHDGQVRFCLRDVHGITDKMVLLTQQQVVLAVCLDGRAEAADLQSSFSRETLYTLSKLLREYPGKVCLLSGADLAHVGPRFGDAEPLPRLIPWMEAEDRKSLDALLDRDPGGFHRSVMHDGGKRRVCGLASLYAFLWLLRELSPAARGRLLRYEHASDPAGGEVSFASVAFSV